MSAGSQTDGPRTLKIALIEFSTVERVQRWVRKKEERTGERTIITNYSVSYLEVAKVE